MVELPLELLETLTLFVCGVDEHLRVAVWSEGAAELAGLANRPVLFEEDLPFRSCGDKAHAVREIRRALSGGCAARPFVLWLRTSNTGGFVAVIAHALRVDAPRAGVVLFGTQIDGRMVSLVVQPASDKSCNNLPVQEEDALVDKRAHEPFARRHSNTTNVSHRQFKRRLSNTTDVPREHRHSSTDVPQVASRKSLTDAPTRRNSIATTCWANDDDLDDGSDEHKLRDSDCTADSHRIRRSLETDTAFDDDDDVSEDEEDSNTPFMEIMEVSCCDPANGDLASRSAAAANAHELEAAHAAAHEAQVAAEHSALAAEGENEDRRARRRFGNFGGSETSDQSEPVYEHTDTMLVQNAAFSI